MLDLYAGSGALGIEALSRGAASVTFVESSRNALAALRNNVSTLQIDAEVTVISVAVERAAGRLQPYAPFELVLCDPPWDELDAAVQALSVLLGPSLLSEDAIVTLEHPASRGIELPASMPLEPWSVRTWGDTAVSIFRRAGS